VIKMPKDRNPWLAEDVLPEKKTLDVMHRITMMVLIILVTLGLFAFMGA